MTATPTQIARATLTNPRAAHYLAMSHATLSKQRDGGTLDTRRAILLLRSNARDGLRSLGTRADSDVALDRAARILYRNWLSATE